MPELPEVEIVTRGLARLLTGQSFARVEQRRKDLRFPFPERFSERLEGQRITTLSRRAKYILAHIQSGEVLLMHLGMSGRIMASPPRTSRQDARTLASYVYDTGCDPAHDHVRFTLSDGTTLTYNDPRRFGFMLLLSRDEVSEHPSLRQLGVEPLSSDLDAMYLARHAAGRTADLKSFLLNQHVIAGLGNIYVCEALHRARLSPKREARGLATRGGLPHERSRRLVPAIRDVLNEAIAAGGSTLRDYRHTDGASGSFQERFLVYDREGESCQTLGCGGTIRRIEQGGRSTFYCPRCQR
jgi:formamidopyrimidine-DNA glycosylase